MSFLGASTLPTTLSVDSPGLNGGRMMCPSFACICREACQRAEARDVGFSPSSFRWGGIKAKSEVLLAHGPY